MNDSGILQQLLEKFAKQTETLIVVCVFVGVNILVGLINLFTQVRLKKLDVDVHKKNIRAEKKVARCEEIYKQMNEISRIFNDVVILQKSLDRFFKYTNESAIYLSEIEIKVCTNFYDYSCTLIINYSQKDIAKEKNFMNLFKEEFQK